MHALARHADKVPFLQEDHLNMIDALDQKMAIFTSSSLLISLL